MRFQIFFPLLAAAILAPAASLAQSREPLPLDELQLLAAAYGMVRSDLAKETDRAELIRHAIRGLVAGADPEAGEYYDPEAFKEFRHGAKRGDSAAGLEVRRVDHSLILAPVAGGPAIAAGIRHGDVLHAVDGKRTRTLQVHEVMSLIRGPEGSRVSLTIFRESSLNVETISVERKSFTLPRTSVSRPSPDVAMLLVPSFQEATLRDATQALRSAWGERPFKAVVLDLRGCQGGLLETAMGIAAIFLPPGKLVAQATGRLPEATRAYRASKDDYARRPLSDPLADLPQEVRALPIAVLVDGGTASGAEIVAAALKDHKRGPLVGQKTFGRASIQTVRPLNPTNGVKITTAYWTSPLGSNIHGVGVEPNVAVTTTDMPSVVEIALRQLP